MIYICKALYTSSTTTTKKPQSVKIRANKNLDEGEDDVSDSSVDMVLESEEEADWPQVNLEELNSHYEVNDFILVKLEAAGHNKFIYYVAKVLYKLEDGPEVLPGDTYRIKKVTPGKNVSTTVNVSQMKIYRTGMISEDESSEDEVETYQQQDGEENSNNDIDSEEKIFINDEMTKDDREIQTKIRKEAADAKNERKKVKIGFQKLIVDEEWAEIKITTRREMATNGVIGEEKKIIGFGNNKKGMKNGIATKKLTIGKRKGRDFEEMTNKMEMERGTIREDKNTKLKKLRMWMAYAEPYCTKPIDLRSAVERLHEELSALEFDACHETVYELKKYYTVRECG
ncbi:hypothetical protein FQA39_LY02804 [Lamprigera yunnana]|nr:hypothetical protein FQA39_LY02804 [Lamprigera yunnana]